MRCIVFYKRNMNGIRGYTTHCILMHVGWHKIITAWCLIHNQLGICFYFEELSAYDNTVTQAFYEEWSCHFNHYICTPGNRLHVYPWVTAKQTDDFLNHSYSIPTLCLLLQNKQTTRHTPTYNWFCTFLMFLVT